MTKSIEKIKPTVKFKDSRENESTQKKKKKNGKISKIKNKVSTL